MPPDHPPDAANGSYRMVAMLAAAAMVMETLDGSVLATALPAMAQSFHTAPLRMNVAMTSYLLSVAVFIPASGRIADRFGARSVFRAAIGLFTLGSALCGVSGSVRCLVFARVVQGVGGAMMVPVGRLALLRVTPKSELVGAMALMMLSYTMGSILGPPVGGVLTTYLSWRWIFYINLPLGVAGMVLVTRFIGQFKADSVPPLDGIGMVLSGVALCCLMSGLEAAGRGMGQNALWIGLLCGGVISFWLYLRHARNQRDPILDFRLMQIPTFAISVVSGCLFRTVMLGAMPFLLPMMLQVGWGLSAAQSGAITFTTAIGALAMRPPTRFILKRFGFRRVLAYNGALCMVLFALESAIRPLWPLAAMESLLFLAGFCAALQFTAYNTMAYTDVPAARSSAALSFYATVQQVSISMGVTIAATVLSLVLVSNGHHTPTLPDFSIAFLVVAGIGLMAAPVALRLPEEAQRIL